MTTTRAPRFNSLDRLLNKRRQNQQRPAEPAQPLRREAPKAPSRAPRDGRMTTTGGGAL